MSDELAQTQAELAQTQAEKEKAETIAAKARLDLDQVLTAQKAAEQGSPVSTVTTAQQPTPTTQGP